MDIETDHGNQLEQLRVYMDKLEFESRIVQQTDGVATKILLVAITADYRNRKRYINFRFESKIQEVLSRSNLLEFKMILPIDLGVHNRQSVEKIILIINNHLEIGNFSILENGEICFRYVYTTHRIHGINEEQLVETVVLYIAMVDMYEQLIEQVSMGNISVENALNLLRNDKGNQSIRR